MEPPWLTKARAELGIAEIPGGEANPRIVEYFAETKYKATSDEIAWCSAFACAMMEWSGVPSPRSARARDWLTWGTKIERPVLGCVVVMARGGSPLQGHVGFYMGESPGFIDVLGGNQQNRVCIQSFPLVMVIEYRLPGDEYWSPYKDDATEGDTRYS